MVCRMFINDVINYLRERDKKLKGTRHVVAGKGKEEIPKALYLEEDCSVLSAGSLKRGHLLSLEEARLLRDYGFHLIWVTDEEIIEADKRKDEVSYYKGELENILIKHVKVIDEQAHGKKPGSAIHYIERNDLLRQTLEPLQLEGAKYIRQSLFGKDTNKQMGGIKYIFNILYNKQIDKVGLYNSYCLGNMWELKQKKTKLGTKLGTNKKERVRSNFVLMFMLDIVLAFVATINKLQTARMRRGYEEGEEGIPKREPYNQDEIVEGSLSALFCEYGYLHHAIDLIMQRNTNPYYTNKGELEGSGYTTLDEMNELIVLKRAHVSNYIFTSANRVDFTLPLSKDILRNNRRWLNGEGYPKRKLITTKISQRDEEGSIELLERKTFDGPIHEMTRLVGIISFFVDCLAHTPLHIPFQRDCVVRHMLLNSEYNRYGREIDRQGKYDFDTYVKHTKRFDKYLLESFLSSVSIYKIGEQVPIYNFNNSKEKLYDAKVIRYNSLPNRPVVKVLSGKVADELDLSKKEHDFIYIGEYIPTLLFQDVIDEYYLDYKEAGITIKDFKSKYTSKDDKEKNDNGGEEEKVVENLFNAIRHKDMVSEVENHEGGIALGSEATSLLVDEDDMVREEEEEEEAAEEEEDIREDRGEDAVTLGVLEEKVSLDKISSKGFLDEKRGINLGGKKEMGLLYNILFRREGAYIPYCLGEEVLDGGVSAKDVRSYKVRYQVQFVGKEGNKILYKYKETENVGEDEIIQISVSGERGEYILGEECKELSKTFKTDYRIEEGDYRILYYMPSKDPSKKDKKGGYNVKGYKVAKYIVEVKEFSKAKSVVEFLRYFVLKGDKLECTRDQNCGKKFDLNKLPFFVIGEELTGKEMVEYFGLTLR